MTDTLFLYRQTTVALGLAFEGWGSRMACVTVTNVTVLDNPARFENPFQVSATTAASRRQRCTATIPFAPPPPPTYRGFAP